MPILPMDEASVKQKFTGHGSRHSSLDPTTDLFRSFVGTSGRDSAKMSNNP
jgi:hypothetical protein